MIAIQVVDEEGTVEREFDDPRAIYPLMKSLERETACLQFIDPYGDTTFNPRQVERLLEELEEAAIALQPGNERRQAIALIEFLRPVAGQLHTYVKFVGD